MHTIIHWIIHELWLTWKQVQQDITIPRIVAGTIGYGLVHGCWKFINREKELIELKRRVAMLHVKKRHLGRFSHCVECKTILARHLLEQPQLPAEDRP